jgi:CRP/FNR family transcriptional regulator, cyclic AMP receptor protein
MTQSHSDAAPAVTAAPPAAAEHHAPHPRRAHAVLIAREIERPPGPRRLEGGVVSPRPLGDGGRDAGWGGATLSATPPGVSEARGLESGATIRDFRLALSGAEAEALDERAVRRTFARGQALCHQGQVADRVMILTKGRVKVSSTTAAGREVVLAFLGPGELLGELGAVDGAPRSASIVALESVEVLALAPRDFQRFLAQHPTVVAALLRTLSERLRDSDVKRIEFAALDALGRVAMRLLELCERFGEVSDEHVDVLLPLSQEELAGWAGASREAVARALYTMRSLGWIETSRRRVRVLDVAALRRAGG